MKPSTLALLLAAAVTTAAPDLGAQTKPSPKAASQATRMDLVDIPECVLKDSIRILDDRLQFNELPPMNIIMGPGTDELKVPALNLRNVNGADALRLICAAADCELEPIFSEPGATGRADQQVIGYRIVKDVPLPPSSRSRSTSGFGGTRSAISFTRPTGVTSSGPRFAPDPEPLPLPSAPPSADLYVSMKPAKGAEKSTRLMSYGAIKPVAITRVYSLGRTTSRTKFPEIEKTLLAVLEISDHKPSDATLALHENTNVLVIRGSEEVHELVSNLLESLAKNSADAETGEIADLKNELRTLRLEMENIKQLAEMRIQEAEKRRRDAEHELAATKRLRTLEPAQQSGK